MRLIDADEIKYIDMLFSAGNGNYEHVGMVTQYEIDALPTVEAVPISFIEKRIEQLKNHADYEFEANGGYVGGSQYRQWELECLLNVWAERKEE